MHHTYGRGTPPHYVKGSRRSVSRYSQQTTELQYYPASTEPLQALEPPKGNPGEVDFLSLFSLTDAEPPCSNCRASIMK